MRASGILAVLLAACAHGHAPAPVVRPAGGVAAGAEPAPIRAGVAPPPGPYAPGFNALHYDVRIALPDTGTLIVGRVTASIALRAPVQSALPLDLTGLVVDTVRLNGAAAAYRYAEGKLHIALPAGLRPGDTLHVEVAYHGHADDGLSIGRNVHGERTAFGDNWPDRARFWFPCIDHPSDKATLDMEVVAPAGWRVVANGAPEPPVPLPSGWVADTSRSVVAHWATRVPIPTYTMVLGAGRFVVGQAPGPPAPGGPVSGGPVAVSWWLFPEDTADAGSFRRANEIVAFYESVIGPFPYEKLAHVESATRFGGMENASAIFYDEKAIAQKLDIEETVAHETAHQWFGDAVTESDWHHLWLSEGFATYFSALFFEHAEGEDRFRAMMAESKAGYLQSGVTDRPVIDPAQGNLLALLDRNNYDKGAWVLHMLRGLLGDSAFFGGIRRYYAAHVNGNALTPDLQQAMEAASGRTLGWFFQQWLYQPGYPRLHVAWRWLPQEKVAVVTIRQAQPAAWPTFRFPITIELATSHGSVRRETLVTGREHTLRVTLPAAPTSVTADPDGRLLATIEKDSDRALVR